MTSRRLLLPIAVAVAALAIPLQAANAKAPSAAEQRKAVSRQKAAAAAKVNALKASQTQLEHALDTLNRDAAAKSARAESAQRAYVSAAASANRVRSAEAQTAQRLHDVQSGLKSVAITAYMKGESDSPELATINIADITRARGLMHAVSGAASDRIDELDSVRRELTGQRAQADAAEARARQRQQAVTADLRAANAAKAANQRLVDQAESRLEQALAESAALEATDRRLAAQIAASQRGLARRTSGSSRGGTTRRPGNVSTTTVRGITVATSIADQLDRLLSAADAAGLHLGGSGYRDSSSQVALRRQHCGTSDYDVYDKPASQCHPPTARPGQSMHEQGLAVDFTNNGSIIRSHSDEAFRWLQGNASRFGFYNLPSEAWHWSTNGN